MYEPSPITKTNDSRSGSFGAVSVELDAIAADILRDLVHGAIERRLPANQLEQLRLVEQRERRLLYDLVGRVDGE